MKAHLKNQENLLKSSISLLETLISLVILSTIAVGFSKITHNSSKNETNFELLNIIENNFSKKDYSNFQSFNSDLIVVKNLDNFETIQVKKYQFLNNNIKVFKYEK